MAISRTALKAAALVGVVASAACELSTQEEEVPTTEAAEPVAAVEAPAPKVLRVVSTVVQPTKADPIEAGTAQVKPVIGN
jgi:hypothetical protein